MKQEIKDHHNLRSDLLVLGIYVVLSLVLTYPLAWRFTTHVAGRYVDTRVFQWNNWWVKHALFGGLDLQYTDYMYYPSGVSLVSHNFNWVSSLVSVPLDLLFGPTVAYNLTFLLTFLLSTFGMYVLVRHVVQRRDAAFVAGLVFAFSPYHVSGNWDGQMNLANIQWLPLVVLGLLRTLERQRVRDAVLLGVFGALASLDCWFFVIFLAIWGALFLVCSLVWERNWWNWRAVGLLFLAALVSGLLVSPFLWPVLAEGGEDTVEHVLAYYADEKATDLMAFLVPSSDHPLLSRYAASAYARFKHWRPAFWGYSVLALSVYATLMAWRTDRARRRTFLWLLSALLFAALALGTQLNVNGVAYPGVPMPYRWLLALLPALKIVRQASRFNVMVSLFLAVLVGLACADLFDRLGRRISPRLAVWIRYGATGLLSVLVLLEYLAVPCPLSPSQVSPFYHALAGEEGDFAILELPLDDFHSREYLYPQTFHHKKLVNGYVARTPAGTQAFIRSHPLIKALQVQMEVDPALHDIPAEIGLLAANGIRYVVIHKQPLPPQPPVNDEVLGSWRTLFGPLAYYEDDQIVVYQTRLAPERSLAPILRFGDELGLTDIRSRRTRSLAEGLAHVKAKQSLTVDLTWKALDDLDRNYACRLSLSGPAGTIAQTGVEVISPHYPTVRWPAGVVVAERYALPLDPSLPAGDYSLSVKVMDLFSGEELDALDYAIQIGDHPHLLTPVLEGMRFPVEVTFGGEMQLLGYTPYQEGNRLTVEMYWQALRVMETNYKIFVHLIRSSDGAIVVQRDVMPRDWSYPTSLWARQEVFVDRIELDVSDVGPGGYRLAVGMYEPAGDRLVALDADNEQIPDHRVIFDEAIEVRKQ